MDEAKFQVIRDWPTAPKGLGNPIIPWVFQLYRRFIASYSDMTIPPTRPLGVVARM
jgi:hypothetical protein